MLAQHCTLRVEHAYKCGITLAENFAALASFVPDLANSLKATLDEQISLTANSLRGF
ncbi:MAG: hypothetical protein HOC33_17505 [Alphaproteobacteria bacterium]|nr:hypothetical protein [Alphaproteobacteria bacterium]